MRARLLRRAALAALVLPLLVGGRILADPAAAPSRLVIVASPTSERPPLEDALPDGSEPSTCNEVAEP